MKTLLSCLLVTIFIVGVSSLPAFAEDLPDVVKSQSRKGATETEIWKKFDKSGAVKFLQVQHTAAASKAGTAAKLDGSFGERLLEIEVDSSIESEFVVWTLENKGPGIVWAVAKSDGLEKAVEIKPEESASLETTIAEGYCYIVVDSDGRNETTLKVTAKAGETDAKTVRGKSMKILWF
ncbi:hypothetical protein CSA56_12625 [candidate division KSB3 bacterium]|uniref:Secreted protein n=1 Tax=candidate division KSB3 bacterium TaxID=2044937 RepID=A0A2G6KBW8_9BACT|nr:MAG: hypothetical protein CSA56_12625 [candidate division KSB3 bacterium]